MAAYEAFPAKLEGLRKARGIKRQEAADEIGITRATLENYEKGNRKPDIKTLATLCEYYNVSADYLLGIPLTVRRNTVSEIQKTIINYVERYKDALIYLQNIEQLTHQLTAADTPTDDETADEYAGVNRDFSGGRYDGA